MLFRSLSSALVQGFIELSASRLRNGVSQPVLGVSANVSLLPKVDWTTGDFISPYLNGVAVYAFGVCIR